MDSAPWTGRGRAALTSSGEERAVISADRLLIDPQAVRESARRGELARWAADATESERRRLTGAVYEIALPLVFNGLTRRLEQQRGHAGCAASLRGMTDDCFDR